jgi:hypothetical protein
MSGFSGGLLSHHGISYGTDHVREIVKHHIPDAQHQMMRAVRSDAFAQQQFGRLETERQQEPALGDRIVMAPAQSRRDQPWVGRTDLAVTRRERLIDQSIDAIKRVGARERRGDFEGGPAVGRQGYIVLGFTR